MPTRSDRTVPRRKIADDAGVHVNFVTDAEVVGGTIFVKTRGSSLPYKRAVLQGIAGAQLTDALLDHLHIRGGTWTSWATFDKRRAACQHFLNWLQDEVGIDNLADPAFTPEMAWHGVMSVGGSGGRQRNFRTFLAEALRGVRADAEEHHAVLHGRALPVDEHDLQGYAPEVAHAIEQVAKAQVGRWFVHHRAAVRVAFGGGLPRDWMRRPAEDLCGADLTTCPDEFKVHPDDLAAAMVLLSLIDDKGPNLSVIHSHTSDSVQAAGDTAFVTSVKARNRQVLHTPAPNGGLYSYAGLLEFVTAATRVERYVRDDGSDFARLLFVASGSSSVVSGQQVRSWWQRTVPQWPAPTVPRPDSLSFPRLRKAALLRGREHSRIVVGHSRRTSRLYLADALPDVILIPGLVDTQNSVTEYCRSQMLPRRPGDEEVAERLAEAPAVLDVGVAMCASNGQSPSDTEMPCGLGPVACFICPSGYRTPEVIPGLIAAVEFTDGIRKHEPNEWLTSEAPVLQTLARKALDQFPQPLVNATSREDIDNARALIACVYLEGRRRD